MNDMVGIILESNFIGKKLNIWGVKLPSTFIETEEDLLQDNTWK